MQGAEERSGSVEPLPRSHKDRQMRRGRAFGVGPKNHLTQRWDEEAALRSS